MLALLRLLLLILQLLPLLLLLLALTDKSAFKQVPPLHNSSLLPEKETDEIVKGGKGGDWRKEPGKEGDAGDKCGRREGEGEYDREDMWTLQSFRACESAFCRIKLPLSLV